MIFDFNCSNFDNFLDFVVNGNVVIFEDKQKPDLTRTHYADEFLIKITNKEVNTITLIYEQIKWNLDFDLDSQIKIRFNKQIPETNQVYYKLDELQQVWGVTDKEYACY